MADDKEIKYLMHCKQSKISVKQKTHSRCLYTADFDSSEKQHNLKKTLNKYSKNKINFNNVTIIVHKKNRYPTIFNTIESINHFKTSKEVVKCYSTSIFNSTFLASPEKSHQHQHKKKKSFQNTRELANFNFGKWDVYRCQFSTQEESCCCSCNSDAMFEVMKSLYDCYKKKDCDHCNCILCGHLPREERRLGELRKSGDLAAVSVKAKGKKKKKIKSKEIIAAKEGKTPEEKEAALKKIILSGATLPEPKTQSEKELIAKVKTQLALPPEPRTKSEKEIYRKAEAEGLITPLEGKTKSQKTKILQKQMDLGLPLPEGRTPSEKALIEKIRSAAVISASKVPSEKLRKAKKEGLLTPLEGKTPEQKETILKGLAMNGIPLPKGKSSSERQLIDKVRADLGLPPEPKTSSDKNNYRKALAAGLITPLEGKSHPQKEDLLRKQAAMGLSLPQARTASEKSLIAKIQQTARHPSEFKVSSEKIKKAKAAGLLTPLEGKTPKQKENIIRGLAMNGIPLPEGKTNSERKLIDKIRADLGLPPEPKSESEKKKYKKALAAGLITPLEGKSQSQKKEILKKQAAIGLSLPQGRTRSEKSIIAKIQQTSRPSSEFEVQSEKLKKVKAAGLLTPLEGKTSKQKEDILKGLAMNGIPLPEGKSDSDRKIIDKVRADLGLPPEPKTASEKSNYKKALAAGLITPLEGKSLPQKEELLKKQAAMGLPLPQGRTPSEKSLIAKIQQTARPPSEFKVPSEKMKKAKAAGLLTPLAGKTSKQKEDILKGLAMNGIPLPEGKSDSERKIIDKVRVDLGLPPEPKTASEKSNYKKALAAGLITPLEGKSLPQREELLKKQAAMGLPLPQGRTPSEKSLIAKIQQTGRPPSEFKVPSEKMKKAKAAGLLTPLAGKTSKQKEDILKGLAMNGIPLPEGKSYSDRKIIDKVRTDLGLPPEPKTASEKSNYKKALAAGLITPLEGKSLPQKEELLKKQAAMGLPLPQGRTPSEKSLIAKIQQTARPPSEFKVPSEKMKKVKAAGLLTPLAGKTSKQKEDILKGLAMNGIPLPEGKSDSERKIIDKVRADLGLPPEPKTASEKSNYKKALAAGLITPLEGKSLPQKEELLKKQAAMGLPLPQGRTPSEKSLIAKIQQTAPPTIGFEERERLSKKLPTAAIEREKALKDLVFQGKPLPEAKTASEEKLLNKVRHDLGLPPEPKSKADKEKYNQALAAGIIVPLEGKSTPQKEKILQAQADMGLTLPEGRTASEKAIIKQIKSGKRKRAKSLPPAEIKKLDTKTAKNMKEGKGPSDECICDILTPESEKLSPKSKSRIPSEKLKAAKAAGLLTPLQGKSDTEKEKILKGLAQRGIPLPIAQTASEKKIIDKVRKDLGLPPEPKTPSIRDRYNQAQEAGIITPLEGKPLAQKEKILIKQAEMGLPLPEGRTPSEKDLINRIRTSVPKKVTSEKLRKAKEAGLLTPLEGKSTKEKERILKSLAKEGLPLPEPKTASEKKLIEKVKTEMGMPVATIPSERLRKAKADGLLTPLEGKSQKDKERILKSLAKQGLPLPEPKTASEKKLIAKVKTELGVPLERLSSEKLRKAKMAGLLTPLEGKSQAQKEKILKGRIAAGLPLPEGKTSSEKSLIKKIKADTGYVTPTAVKSKSRVTKIPSEKLKAAKAAGLLTPLHGKTDAQKEKILKGLASHGIPLPKAQTASEKRIMDKVRKELGLPPEPKTPSLREKYRQAHEKGFLTPLEGKTTAQKEKILRKQVEMGIPLPEGRTPSEKDIINKVRDKIPRSVASEKLRKAKEAGLLTPLQGKSAKEKEKILKGLAKAGLPLPEGKTASEKQLIKQVRADMGIPLETISSEKLRRAMAEGLITPLHGKSPTQKEKILRGRVQAGLPLPEGVSPSDKELIKKIKAETGYVTPRVEKLKKVSEAAFPRKEGTLTPGQREKVYKNLVAQGKPLPEAKTASEEKLLNKVRHDLGLPPEPKSKADKEKYNQALAAGIIVPLEGKSTPQKEKILQAQADMGLTLPEGRTASEKAIIKQIKSGKRKRAKSLPPAEIKKLDTKTAKNMKEGKGPSDECICDILTPESEKLSPKSKSRIPSEKLKAAKAAGLLTPLQGKSDTEKEKILKGLAQRGIPLPIAQTASEKKIIDKVRKDLGLPPEPKTPSIRDRYNQAQEAGIITPLEGKPLAQKEKILIKQAEMGLPLPEGRTPSEKDLINRIRTSVPKKVTSEKLRKAKEAGLLTPLEGKSTKEKERILKSLAKEGLPLPEPKTASEKKLIQKVKTELGMPIAAIPSEKLRKAKAAGFLTPLQGKSDDEKERIFKGLAQNGIPLPKAQTTSEKKIIDKVRKELGLPPEPKTPSIRDKYSQAQAAGIITPLEGKSMAQKERILTKQAEMGIPLPEGRTQSERDLINRIRETVPKKTKSDMTGEIGGIPVTASNKEMLKKAKTEGLLTPLKGKSTGEKERIIKGLAEAGLPMPEAKTQSEKALIQKVRTSLGLPPELTSIKRDKIKTKSKKVGLEKTKKSEIAVGVGKSKVGITEEFQDVIKTTTCDRGCGCDRKKIRFKHSYVKIRVTSPDISSLCPCPDECVPGVKGGVFTDNEGIKVTVGQMSTVPSFPSKEYTPSYKSTTSAIKNNNNQRSLIPAVLKDSTLTFSKQNKIIESTKSFDSYKVDDNHKTYLPRYYNDCVHINKYSKSDTYIFIKSSEDLSESDLSTDMPILMDKMNSLFFSSPSNSSILSNTISIISISVSDCSSNSAYLIERISMNYLEQSRENINEINIDSQEYYQRKIKSNMSTYSLMSNISYETEFRSNMYAQPKILRLSTQNVNNHFNKKTCLKTYQKLNNVIDKLLSEQTLKESSSLYVLLPTSSEDNSSSYSYESQLSSTICIQVSEKPFNCNGCYGNQNRNPNQKRHNLYHGFKIAAKGRNTNIERERRTVGSYIGPNKIPQQNLRIKDIEQTSKKYEICTDTTEDRPCCCDIGQIHSEKEPLKNETNMTNVISELVAPFIINDVISQGFSHENYGIIPNRNIYTTKKVCVNQTPVRLCKIPPCSNFSDCPSPKNILLSEQFNSNQMTSKQCECDFEKIKEIIEKIGKEFISTACGISSNINTKTSKENGYVKPIIKKTNYQDTSESLDCISCNKPPSKEEQKKQCPCERHTSFISKDLGAMPTSTSKNENYKTNIEQNSNKKNKKKNKKHICECPSVPSEDEFDPILWVDEAQIRKMKSVLTQNTSGFKINRVRKVPEPEMSFEEALSYVIQSDEEKYRRLLCLCEDKHGAKKKKSDCECPSIQEIPEKMPEPEPKGIKLYIGGKGSSSKGLSGVLCFQLLDEN